MVGECAGVIEEEIKGATAGVEGEGIAEAQAQILGRHVELQEEAVGARPSARGCSDASQGGKGGQGDFFQR